MLLPAIVSCARPHRSGGLAFSLPFWRWWKTQRREAAAGGLRPPARCRASPAAGMFWGRGLWPRPQNAAAPRMAAPILPAPQAIALVPAEKRWRRDGWAPWAAPGGGGVLRPGPQNGKRGAGGKAFGSPFSGRCAPPPPPRGRWKFRRPSGWSACFYDPKPTHKTSPPLPMSGGPA